MTGADIQQKLRDHGISPTPQRLRVAAIMLAKDQHLSVEQILAKLRDEGGRVSKATVYNTLNLFEERGLVREVCVDPERRYFDSAMRPHQHYYNVDTGELIDIPDTELELADMPPLPPGTVTEGVDILIRVRNVRQ